MHRSILKWHRYLGVVIALTVVVVAVTGIFLNHTHALGLDRRSINSEWLMRAYGAEVPRSWSGYPVDEQTWVLQIEDRLLVNDNVLSNTDAPLVGAVRSGEFLLVATQRQVFLFDQARELVEEMTALQGIDGTVLRVGLGTESKVWLEMRDSRYLVADEFISNWLPATQEELMDGAAVNAVAWSSAKQVPGAILKSLKKFWFGEGVTLERLVLDLHSGRVFRKAGVVILDLAGLGMIALAFTGVWMWGRRVARQRR